MNKFTILTDEALADRLEACGQWLTTPGMIPLPDSVPEWFEPFAWLKWRKLCRRLEGVGLPVPDDRGLRLAYIEGRIGQGYDDAGGFYLRIYRAAFNWPYRRAWDSASAVERPAPDAWSADYV